MRNLRLISMLGLAACFWFVHGAAGSTIGGVYALPGPPVAISGVVNTPAPCVDPGNPGYQGPNTLTFNENVTQPTAQWDAAFDINVNSCGGQTEYFVTKNITNNTGLNWDDFDVETGSVDPIECQLAGVAGGPTISGAGTQNATQSCSLLQQAPDDYLKLSFNNLSVASGETIKITYAMDICAQCGGLAETVQDYSVAPTPEPAPALLGGVSLVMLGLWRRRRSAGEQIRIGTQKVS